MAEDIKMNAFTPAADSAYIYGEAADGSQVKLKKSDLVELIRVNMPIARFGANGLYDSKFAIMSFYSGSNSDMYIRLFKSNIGGFSGKISAFFCRSEEYPIISEFNIYAQSFNSVEKESNIKICRRSGEHSNIKFYRDDKHAYAHFTGPYHFIYFKLEVLTKGDLILEEVSGIDISLLIEIPINI